MPQRIDKYEILEPICRGAAGVVHRAMDSKLKRVVALKIFSSEPELTGELRSRLLCEAKLWSALGHPNLASIHDVGEEGGTSWVVMELPDGSTLDELTAERTAMPLEQKIAIATQLAGALHYAHQRGLVHGDIRPANIIVADDGAVKLGDFRVEKPFDSLSPEEIETAVTPYTAPEQLRGRVDAHSDQYALAAVLYELVSGRTPHAAADRAEFAATLAGSTAEIPPELAVVIERAMSPETSDRYADLRVFRSELEAVLTARTASVVPSVPVTPRPDRPLLSRPTVAAHRPSEGWAWSNETLIVLASAAAISLFAAWWVASPDEDLPERVAVTQPEQAPTAAERLAPLPSQAALARGASKDSAEAARDRALAARFGSAKKEATYYAPELHLAAQRKEAEADAAISKSDYVTATVLYDMARDGYDLAAQKSEIKATTIEKQNIDSQLAAEAQARSGKVTVGSAEIMAQPPPSGSSYASAAPAYEPYARTIYPPSDQGAQGAQSGIAHARPSSVEPPKIVEIPRAREDAARQDDERAGDRSKPLGAYAAVFAEPTDGNRHGGTWGACWRGDSASARECARASCENSRRSNQPCVQVALSRPGQHCAVARASGFGVSWGACGETRTEAEHAALGGCRSEAVRNYGAVSPPCAVAWSTAQ